jgi:peptide chain release factor 2
MNDVNFWDNKTKAEEVIKEFTDLKDIVDKLNEYQEKVKNNLEIIEDVDDRELLDLLEIEIKELEKDIADFSLLMFLGGPYDKNNAILEIHPGAGGTESCDWASMLYRMYNRWCEKKNYKTEVIDYSEGEEAGIKSVTILIKGINAYGYLKGEKGIHRLIRISPFDANKRRHTSFASIDVTPEFDDNIDIEIKDSDLKIDVYRSSGAGGQSVNTTDSAVRITHLPTKIVVTCQSERSQIKNKELALRVLKNKLYKIELEKKEMELDKIKGERKDIDFGSQIRSYILHPYKLIKDHRTNYEETNVEKVLDGDIDNFIDAYLKKGDNK